MIYITHMYTFDEYQNLLKETNNYKIKKVTRGEVLDRILLFLYNNNSEEVTITIEDRDFRFIKNIGVVIDSSTGEIMCMYDDEFYRFETDDWLLEEYKDEYRLDHGFVKITRTK